ncbi:MAG: hypothetical protein EOP50_04905 [Sphingobacteriales bacterium]|nr:MAG: hypothetical protein EOP50_04905 [Sphingobacteriales bacterium]
MQRFTPALLVFLFLVFCTATAQAQGKPANLAAQEQRLAKLYEKLLSFAQRDYDSTELYSERFDTEFKRSIRNNSATLNYPFRMLTNNNYCSMETAPGGAFRIYSWDTWTGGTMHFFHSIYQWRAGGKVYTSIPAYDEGDPGSFCSKIYTLRDGARTYYLAVSNAIYSTKDARQSVAVYAFDGGKLIDTVKLFRTGKERLERIDVDFDFFSVVDRPERPLQLITYDEKRGILYIPVVGRKDAVTGRNILYQWKGRYFQFIAIEKGKRK